MERELNRTVFFAVIAFSGTVFTDTLAWTPDDLVAVDTKGGPAARHSSDTFRWPAQSAIRVMFTQNSQAGGRGAVPMVTSTSEGGRCTSSTRICPRWQPGS